MFDNFAPKNIARGFTRA